MLSAISTNMSQYKVYDVKCKSCGNTNRVGIDHSNNRIDWINAEPIVSGRLRFDGEWGWECTCGNNDILTTEENKYWQNKNTQPQPKEMKKILDELKPHKAKFEMVTV